MVTYICDSCGKVIHRRDIYTATIKRLGNVSGRQYQLCGECAKKAKSALSSMMQAVKFGDAQ